MQNFEEDYWKPLPPLPVSKKSATLNAESLTSIKKLPVRSSGIEDKSSNNVEISDSKLTQSAEKVEQSKIGSPSSKNAGNNDPSSLQYISKNNQRQQSPPPSRKLESNSINSKSNTISSKSPTSSHVDHRPAINFPKSSRLQRLPQAENSSNYCSSSSQQREALCANCGSKIVYTHQQEGISLVRCYNCPYTNSFLDDVVELEESNVSDPSSIDFPELSEKEFNEINLSRGTRLKKSEQINAKLSGAMKTLRTKAHETKSKVANSNLMEKTKEFTQKASTQTKILAHKASQETKELAQRAKNETKELAQRARETLIRPKESNSASSESPSPKADDMMSLPAITPLTRIFGIPLEEAIEKSSTIKANVPDIVSKCVNFLFAKGLMEEGIFRLSGSSQKIKELKDAFDRGEDISLSNVNDEHIVAGLLKLYFRELPEPIFTEKGNSHLKTLEKLSGDILVQNLVTSVNTLPAANHATLETVFTLLSKVIEYKDKNKMSVSNLAIVWSPTLIISIEIITALISHCDEIFHCELIEL